MKTIIIVLISIAIGIGAGLWITPYLNTDMLTTDKASEEKKPLYWVAPMDPNYRRDGPGKSPMGMDLVPVYEEDNSTSDAGPGTIKINASVVNNLGVRTATAEKRPLQQSITTVGYVQYDQESLIHIHPRVEGWVEKLYVKAEGDPVEKNQALYALYSPQLVTAQEELLIALNRKNQQLISAAKDRLRALQLSNWFIDQLIQTRKVRQTVTFYAPQSGVMDSLSIREGFYVKPSTSMMSIGALDEVWVEAEVFERQAGLIEEGLPVTMTLDYKPNKRWEGKIDYIYPTLDAKTRTLRIRVRFTNDDKQLKPNMFARIHIQSQSDTSSLVIPNEAIIHTGNQNRVVLALGEGQFKSIAVRLGQSGDQWTEIVDGINEGDKVVTSAQFLLDSESSKTSDFVRMETQQPTNVWAAARVVAVMPESGMVKLDHDPIPEWEWPTMTMMFSVDDSIDMETLKAGQSLHVSINKANESEFVITEIHIMEDKNNQQPMDHSQHSDMNHGDHQTMDHSQHGGMNHEQHNTENTQSMNHSDHQMMDHSQHGTMNHDKDQGVMDHAQHTNMNHDQHAMEPTAEHTPMDHTNHQTMDHSQHSNMNHEQHNMEKSEENKSTSHMDHSTMDHSQHNMPDQSAPQTIDHSKMHH